MRLFPIGVAMAHSHYRKRPPRPDVPVDEALAMAAAEALANPASSPAATFRSLREDGFPRQAAPQDKALLGVVACMASLRWLWAPDTTPAAYCHALLDAALGGYWPGDFPLGGSGPLSASAIAGDIDRQPNTPALQREISRALCQNPALDEAHVALATHALAQRHHAWESNPSMKSMAAYVLLAAAMLPLPSRADVDELLAAATLPATRTQIWMTALGVAAGLRATLAPMCRAGYAPDQVCPPAPATLLGLLPSDHAAGLLDGMAILLASGRDMLLPRFADSTIADSADLTVAQGFIDALGQAVTAWPDKAWAVVEGRLAASARKVGVELRRILSSDGGGGFHVSQYRKLLASVDALEALSAGHSARHAILEGGQATVRNRPRA